MTVQELITKLAVFHPYKEVIFADGNNEDAQVYLLDVYEGFGGAVIKVGNADS